MPAPVPDTDFYCPVCGTTVERLVRWLQPGTTRARMFCRSCAARPEYAALPPAECEELDRVAFGRWATRRLLRNVFVKEHK